MLNPARSGAALFAERRAFHRYAAPAAIRVTVENISLDESLGLGAATDISAGGIRVARLRLPPTARAGDRLRLMLMSGESIMFLRGVLIGHTDTEHFGIALHPPMSQTDRRDLDLMLNDGKHRSVP